MSDQEVLALRRQVMQLRQEMNRRPVITGGGGATGASASSRVLVVIDGNTIGGALKGVSYASSVSLSSLPDINSTADTVDGLGRAYLYVNGALIGRVWIRHDRQDSVPPLIASARRLAGSTVSIDYGSGSLTAYHWIP